MALQFSRVTKDEGEVGEIMMRDFLPPFRKGYLRLGPHKVVVPEYYLEFCDAIRDFDVREDDVWVMSHPKTGSTWLQEMVWCIANDLDFQRARKNLKKRFPFFESTLMKDLREVPSSDRIALVSYPIISDSVQYVNDLKSPRFIKTHLHWSLLPQQIRDGSRKPKIVYICRNAKDTCISYFHHSKLLNGYTGNFDDFCKLFIGDSVCFAPFWSHVLQFWERRNHSNILFLKYEDLKKDLPSAIRQTADFLGKTLNDQQVTILANHLSFESMTSNKAVNREDLVGLYSELSGQKLEGKFMRSGTVGDWKRNMSNEMTQKFDAWTREALQGTGLVLQD